MKIKNLFRIVFCFGIISAMLVSQKNLASSPPNDMPFVRGYISADSGEDELGDSGGLQSSETELLFGTSSGSSTLDDLDKLSVSSSTTESEDKIDDCLTPTIGLEEKASEKTDESVGKSSDGELNGTAHTVKIEPLCLQKTAFELAVDKTMTEYSLVYSLWEKIFSMQDIDSMRSGLQTICKTRWQNVAMQRVKSCFDNVLTFGIGHQKFEGVDMREVEYRCFFVNDEPSTYPDWCCVDCNLDKFDEVIGSQQYGCKKRLWGCIYVYKIPCGISPDVFRKWCEDHLCKGGKLDWKVSVK